MKSQKVSYLVKIMVTFVIVSGILTMGASAQQNKEPIKIGVAEALTGPGTALGHHSLWGEKLAVKQINEAGGIRGRKVEAIIEDTKTEPSEAVKVFRKLVLQDKVDLVIAGTYSLDGLAMVKPAKQLKTLYLVTVPESPLITTELLHRYVFRLTPDCRQKARAFAPWLVKNVAKRWNIIYHDFAWGQGLQDEFTRQFEKYGGRVTTTIAIPLGTTDFSSYLTKLDPNAPGIFLAVAGEDSVRLNIQLDEFGITKKHKIAGTCDTIFPENFAKLADEMDGAYVVEQYPPRLAPPVDTAWDKKFREEFKEISDGIEPGPHSWCGYEWFWIVKYVMEEIGYEDKNDIPEVIKALEGLRLGQGPHLIQGPVHIRAEDHQGLIRLFIWQLKDGKVNMKKVVEPEESWYPPYKDIREESF